MMIPTLRQCCPCQTTNDSWLIIFVQMLPNADRDKHTGSPMPAVLANTEARQ
jgi:hypothetical protein